MSNMHVFKYFSNSKVSIYPLYLYLYLPLCRCEICGSLLRDDYDALGDLPPLRVLTRDQSSLVSIGSSVVDSPMPMPMHMPPFPPMPSPISTYNYRIQSDMMPMAGDDMSDSDGISIDTDISVDMLSPKNEMDASKSSISDEEKSKSDSCDREDTVTISATGVFTPVESFFSRLNQAVCMNKSTPMDLIHHLDSWSEEADYCLIEYVNSSKNPELLFTNPASIYLPRTFMTFRSNLLSQYSILDIQARIIALGHLNTLLKNILPVVNIQNSDPYSLGSSVRRLNKYLFMYIKLPLLEQAIQTTCSTGSGLPASLNLDNMKSIASREKIECDPFNSNNCFVQAFKQLNHKDPKVFRHVFSSDRVFQIQFDGENGIDAGGVFREGMTRIVEDLFGVDYFSLLVQCPNALHAVHTNCDKFVPNTFHTGVLAMQMFEFIGKLMGLSLRVKLYLPFEFPPLIWKKILGEEVGLDDLRTLDVITYSLIETVRNCHLDGVENQDQFEEKYGDKLRFVYNTTSKEGTEQELFEGGKDVAVDFDSRHSFCDQMMNIRLHEFDKHIAAITRGLSGVVPMRIVHLFSWTQFELLVCGDPTFDIDVWKANTESTISPSTLSLFWKVMESLSPKEQSGFVRFAWGRSRLPPAKSFSVKMKLTPSVSNTLPVAHTCFFSIEMPNYTTEDEMKHGLLTAIHFGASGVLIG